MLLDLDACAWSAEALGVFGLGGERLPEVVDVAGAVRHDHAFGPALPVTGLLVDQQAALLAQRCLATERPSARTARARSCWRTLAGPPARSTVGADRRRSRGGWAGTTTYCLDGQVYTVGVRGAVAGRPRVVLAGAEDLDAVGRAGRGRRRGDVRARAGRARRAVVARRRARALHGLGLRHRAGPPRARPRRRRSPRRSPSWSTPRPPTSGHAAAGAAGRRRTDTQVAPAHADAGRPAAGPGRGVRVAGRHGARRRRRRRRLGARPVAGPRRRGARHGSRRRRSSRASPPTRPPSGAARFRHAAGRPRLVGVMNGDLTGRLPTYDVAVVGAGVVGSRDRARAVAHGLRVTVLDAADDVGEGTSKANTAILHTGFDATPGTLEAELVRRGHELLVGRTRRAPASRSSAPARCSSPGTTEQLDDAARRWRRRPRPTATTHARLVGRRGAVPARAAPRARRAGGARRCRGRAIV